jgi:hypothetical protein
MWQGVEEVCNLKRAYKGEAGEICMGRGFIVFTSRQFLLAYFTAVSVSGLCNGRMIG